MAGAALSNLIAGYIVQLTSYTVGFIFLAAIGLIPIALVGCLRVPAQGVTPSPPPSPAPASPPLSPPLTSPPACPLESDVIYSSPTAKGAVGAWKAGAHEAASPHPSVHKGKKFEPNHDQRSTTWSAWSTWRKCTHYWGSALLLFAAIVVMSGIVMRVNNPPWSRDDMHWAIDMVLFWIMLTWIAMLEGCQISIVGLQGHDPEAYKETHPRAYKSCKLVLAGPNVERFLVGRQFLLLFNGFLVSLHGTPPSKGPHPSIWPYGARADSPWDPTLDGTPMALWHSC